MIFVVFSEYFNFTTKVVVWAFYKLKLTNFSMALEVLPLDFAPTFVVAFYYFAETSVVVGL